MPVKAIINLKNIVRNAEAVKKRLPSGVKFCAVVKADAYGHGAEAVANALYSIADVFAVATAEEGVKLRYSGIDKEILVLTPTGEETALAVSHRLTLTVGKISDIKRYAREAKRQNTRVKVHIKLDTGMHRQGIGDEEEFIAALKFCVKNKRVELGGIYSHFARPENERSRSRAVKKFAKLKAIAEKFFENENMRDPLREKPVFHISASGGFIKGEYFDMVRIGILLYGYKPFPTDAIKVTPAMKVVAPTITARSLKRGDTALYGDKKVEKDTTVTLIRYGYADGLNRKETDGQFNNRCMDLTAATGIARGARTVAVMENADAAAKKYGTISYEILVKCALRAEKAYIK